MSGRKLLIVSPNFPPANGADSHRVRVTLPFFRENGWQVEVLAVNPNALAVPNDQWLLGGVPVDVPVHRCNAISLRWSSIPGLGTLNLRAFWPMKRMGDHILRTGNFDLVYFSTTTFALTKLGPHWKKKFGVPFVVDYQDPWFTNYYKQHPETRPPGGKLKYAIVDRIARRQEPQVVNECAGITAVSPAYPDQLAERYTSAAQLPTLVAPFPGSLRDFERVKLDSITQNVFDPADGKIHWVYVGVSGPIMYKTLGALFRALAIFRTAGVEWVERLRLHFIGTSYAPVGTASLVVKPLADRHGVGDFVHEQTDRIAYSAALRCLNDAQALLAPGSDDPAYNASKLLPYLMAEKPLLAIFHENSPVSHLVQRIGGARLVTFCSDDHEAAIADRIRTDWFEGDSSKTVIPMNPDEIENFTDRGHAKTLCEFFDQLTRRSTFAHRALQPIGSPC